MNQLQQQRQQIQSQLKALDEVIAKQAELQQQQIQLEQENDTERQLHQAKLQAYNEAVTTAKQSIDVLDSYSNDLIQQIEQLQLQIAELQKQLQINYLEKQQHIHQCKLKWIELHNKPFHLESKSYFKADMLAKVTTNKQLINDSVGF